MYTYDVSLGVPIKRSGCFNQPNLGYTGNQATGEGLALQVPVFNHSGAQTVITFPFTSAGVHGTMCLPSSADVTWLSDNTLISALRMAGLLAGDAIFPSTEWLNSIQEGESSWIQTAVGACRIKDGTAKVIGPGQLDCQIGIQKGTTGPIKTINFTLDQLTRRIRYAANPDIEIIPEFQALCAIPGEIEKLHPNYVHDWPNAVLSQSERDQILIDIAAMDPWI